jgi:hypothetical protein
MAVKPKSRSGAGCSSNRPGRPRDREPNETFYVGQPLQPGTEALLALQSKPSSRLPTTTRSHPGGRRFESG